MSVRDSRTVDAQKKEGGDGNRNVLEIRNGGERAISFLRKREKPNQSRVSKNDYRLGDIVHQLYQSIGKGGRGQDRKWGQILVVGHVQQPTGRKSYDRLYCRYQREGEKRALSPVG